MRGCGQQVLAARLQPVRIAGGRDPALVGAATLLVLLTAWVFIPRAQAVQSASTDATLLLGVDTVVAVAPTVSKGDVDVQLSDLTIPGQQRDAESAGWRLATNYPTGYQVKIRSTTNPAMRGANATDGAGADDEFADFSRSGCPCVWTTSGFSKGVFGYSAQVTTSSGGAALDTSKWGSASSRKWRGFDDTAYSLFTTPGGAGAYQLILYLRTALPEESAQTAGSYRANLVISVEPAA